MTKKIHFTKMHGAGNDYIYIDTQKYAIDDPEDLAVRLSAYHTGIGSDGLVLIGKSDVADFSMRIFNNDGSEAMMCGNATRCIGKYVYEKGLTNKKEVRLETLSGIKILTLFVDDNNQVNKVTVDMGEPILENKEQLNTTTGGMINGMAVVTGKNVQGTFVSMGNPHFVIFTENVEAVDLPTIGPTLEHHPLFPQRCNIEFAEIRPDGKIRTRVWERGSGITMACGTGACATAVAASITNRAGRQSDIVMDGGELSIDWKADNHIYMTGPAAIAFEGDVLV